MEINFWIIFVAGLIPMVIGFVWYHPKTFGTAWMKSVGLTEEQVNSGNMAVIMGLSYLFACMISAMMIMWTTHQLATQSLFASQPEFKDSASEMSIFFQNFMTKYGHLHRSFGHGAAHGVFAGLFIAFPIIAIKALFERKSWKYILINAGYWLVTLVLICGVVCQFA